MYCYYKNTEINCNGYCYGCSFNPSSNPNGLTYPGVINNTVLQFNYECPNCHGKFNYAVYDSSNTSAFTYKCPFCGRRMEGL